MKNDIYLKVIIGIGIWFVLVTIFAVWEYSILKAEMVLNQKLLSHDLIAQKGPLKGGSPLYVIEMLVWTLLILALGLVWSKVLFPQRNLLERVVFSLIFGIFVMPLSIFIPFVMVTIGTVASTLFGTDAPGFIGPTVGSIVELFVSGQEQVYEFANVFIFFVIGLALLAFKQLRKPTPAPRHS